MSLSWPFSKKRPDLSDKEPVRSSVPHLHKDGRAENIFLGAHNVALVERLCSQGRYVNPNDVLISALRLLEEHEEGREQRRRASYAAKDLGLIAPKTGTDPLSPRKGP
jgi:Arc/MetJ-type ribon-helix-helix transcriptional regulator